MSQLTSRFLERFRSFLGRIIQLLGGVRPFLETVSSLQDRINALPERDGRFFAPVNPFFEGASSRQGRVNRLFERVSRLPERANRLLGHVISLQYPCRRLPEQVNRLPEYANAHQSVPGGLPSISDHLLRPQRRHSVPLTARHMSQVICHTPVCRSLGEGGSAFSAFAFHCRDSETKPSVAFSRSRDLPLIRTAGIYRKPLTMDRAAT